LAVDLQGLFRSGVISYLSGAKVRVGFKNGREGSTLFYTHPVAVPMTPMHALDRYLLVAKSLGAVQTEPVCSIPISREDEQAAHQLLKSIGLSDSRNFVVVNPTARWWTKRWPIDRFARLADLLQDLGFPVVLIGAESDIPEIQRLQALTRTSPRSVTGRTTLKQLAALLKRSSLLITNDSGPMHLAAAVGTPVVAVFGPTDPVRTGPYRHLSVGVHATMQDAGFPIMHTIIRKPVECSPCLSKRCRVGDHRCMMQIEVEEVVENVKKFFGREKRRHNVH
jgi:lipopolysaccharide heptosyltransferase II